MMTITDDEAVQFAVSMVQLAMVARRKVAQGVSPNRIVQVLRTSPCELPISLKLAEAVVAAVVADFGPQKKI
jgi:hypothetical protein